MDVLRESLIDPISAFLWNYVLVYVLIGAGLWFTVRTRFVQVRLFPLMLRTIVGSRKGAEGGISSFQAFAVGLASRVGTGNIAGVAIALTLGGPGAIFWMWVVGLVGMATAFIEATLAQLFKVRSPDGSFRGGPAYYIQRGLGSRRGGVLFARAADLHVRRRVQHGAGQHDQRRPAQRTHRRRARRPRCCSWCSPRRCSSAAYAGSPRWPRWSCRSSPWSTSRWRSVIVLTQRSAKFFTMLATSSGAFGLDEAWRVGRRHRGRHAERGEAWPVLQRGRHGQRTQRGGDRDRVPPGQAGLRPVARRVRRHHGHLHVDGVHHSGRRDRRSTAPANTGEAAGATLTQAAVAATLGDWRTSLMTLLIIVFAFSSVLGNYSYAEVNLVFLGAGPAHHQRVPVVVLLSIAVGALVALARCGPWPTWPWA